MEVALYTEICSAMKLPQEHQKWKLQILSDYINPRDTFEKNLRVETVDLSFLLLYK